MPRFRIFRFLDKRMVYIADASDLGAQAEHFAFQSGKVIHCRRILCKRFHLRHRAVYLPQLHFHILSAQVDALNFKQQAVLVAIEASDLLFFLFQALKRLLEIGIELLVSFCGFVFFCRKRGKLLAGNITEGPAVIEELSATTVLYPGDRAVVHATGALLVECRL